MRKLLWIIYGIIIYLLVANALFFYSVSHISIAGKILVTCVVMMLFLFYQIIPYYRSGIGGRLNTLLGGYTVMLSGCFGMIIQNVLLVRYIFSGQGEEQSVWVFIGSVFIAYGVAFIMSLNGFIRIMVTAKQIKLVWRIVWILCWWVPVMNLFITIYVCHMVSQECSLEMAKQELNAVRKENEICSTKYPVLLVHGVFFRDWQYFNYWGRIPAELQKNGCEIYYGRHQSAAAVKDSAAELLEQIHKIIEETGCEKVNIIAHSKGGLDTRYAIDCLGAAPLVASLTTINTPHKGCLWVDELLEKLPDSLIEYVAKKYNKIFCKLGDTNPDFISAVYDLTAKNCQKRNKEIIPAEGYQKQSVMSLMKGCLSASFPLNLGFLLVKPVEGRNDGLVSETSAQWGKFLGNITCKGRRGISHGDMIDLFRENLKGFDVREYYVMLVKGLKDMGL